MARVVVIGAGLAGLSAAARLARLKHDVIVCERNSGPGGQAGRYERDGFAFDTGPTTLTMPASYRDLFIKTGKTTPIENYLELQPIEPAVRWHFADGTRVDIPNASQGGRMEAIGAAFGPGAAQAWENFIRCGETVWTRYRQGFLNGPPQLSGKRFRVPAEEKAILAELNPADSYSKLTERHLKDWPCLQQAAMSWPARLGTNPLSASSGMVLWPWLEHTFGVWAPAGGIRALVDVVAERARSRGAQLRYDSEVTGVQVIGGVVKGVFLADGGSLPAEVVVAAVEDRILARWLTPDSPVDRGQTEETCSALTVLVALRGIDDAPFQQHVLSEPVIDQTALLTKAQAPDGCSAYTITSPESLHGRPVGHEHWDWSDEFESRREAVKLIEHLDARGFEMSSRLLWYEVRSPFDIVRVAGTPDGATGGAAMVGRTGLIRPPNATGIGGLFHVGASAHPGPGIAFAPLGAALVADAVGRAR